MYKYKYKYKYIYIYIYIYGHPSPPVGCIFDFDTTHILFPHSSLAPSLLTFQSRRTSILDLFPELHRKGTGLQGMGPFCKEFLCSTLCPVVLCPYLCICDVFTMCIPNPSHPSLTERVIT